MSISKLLSGKLAEHFLGRRTYTAPGTVYLSAHTGDPGRTGASEVAAGGYARISVPNDTANWAAANAEGEVANLLLLSFAQATNNWGNVTHFGIWDAASAGNFLDSGQLTNAKNVLAGDQLRFPASSLVKKFL